MPFDVSEGPVFDTAERSALEANPYLFPYLAITKCQLVGLLSAFGEYMIRLNLLDHPVDPALNKAYTALHCCSGRQPVFEAQERSQLALHKYVRGSEDLGKPELIALLEALGRYSSNAPLIPPSRIPFMEGLARAIHAHNALVTFRDRPFTEEEFAEAVRALLREVRNPTRRA